MSAEANSFNTSTWKGVKSVSVQDPVSRLFVPLSADELSFASAGGIDYRNAIVAVPETLPGITVTPEGSGTIQSSWRADRGRRTTFAESGVSSREIIRAVSPWG